MKSKCFKFDKKFVFCGFLGLFYLLLLVFDRFCCLKATKRVFLDNSKKGGNTND